MTARPVVFLGPTLPLADARAVLPDALYLPPVRCGDVLSALRLEPRALLIIDGTYERNPAVWHKELGLALERGVLVVGAASMGALRAAEMEAFGMIGVGGIFEDYRAGRLVDDDEVAVVHAPSGEPLSIAMVDVRATVARAVEEACLDADLAEQILSIAKRTFYAERSFEAVLSRLDDGAAVRRFSDWLRRNGRVERKRSDAIEALRLLADPAWRAPSPRGPPLVVPRTSALRVLIRHVACSALHAETTELPRRERVVRAARFLGDPYYDAKRLAELMAAAYEIAPPGEALDAGEWSPPEADAGTSEQADDRRALLERLAAIARLERQLLAPPADPAARLAFRARTSYPRFLRWLDALDDRRGPTPPTESRVRRLLARAWRIVDLAGQRASLVPRPELLDHLLSGVRLELGLSADADYAAWLAAHGLGRHELAAMAVARFRWHAIASEAQPIGLEPRRSSEGPFWLLDALRGSGLYPRASALLDMAAVERERAAVLPRTLAQALARDFDTDDPLALRRSLATL